MRPPVSRISRLGKLSFGIFSLCLLSLCENLPAEDIRVKLRDAITLDIENPEADKPTALAPSEGVALLLPDDLTFVNGVEFELKIPRYAQNDKGNYLILFYKRARPAPSDVNAQYNVIKLSSLTIPAKVGQAYQIPLSGGAGLKDSPYSVSLPAVDPQDFPLIVKIIPANKGTVTDQDDTSPFTLRARPILNDQGRVKLKLRWPDGLDPDQPVSVSVDDIPVRMQDFPVILSVGDHFLRVSGPNVRDKYLSFSVAPAQTQELSVDMEDVTPKLYLEYPERTRIELDGRFLGREARDAIAVQPGDHSINFYVGDYVVQRHIIAQRGKTYRVSLLVDVRVEEEE
jgi:hypothetical protein